MRRFEGKVSIVTGATTGIGRATIDRLTQEGSIVYGAHRRKADEIDLGEAKSLSLDVTDEAQWGTAIDTVISETGRIDVLVNNAGKRESGRVESTSLALWHDLIDTNLTSIFLGSREVVPHMQRAGLGSIVNVGSITGIRGTENMVAYSASKSGITTLTASLALDLAPHGIRANSVCPAAVDTRMVSDWLQNAEPDDPAAKAIISKHPLGRIGRPEEIAATIAFLASDDAGFITGQSIAVDGGRSIR